MTIPTKNGKIIQESLTGHLHKAILYYLHQIFGKNAHFRSMLATSCNPQSHVPPIGVWPLWLCRPAGCEDIEWNLAGLQAFLLKPSTVDPGFRKLQCPSAYDFGGSKGGPTTHFFGVVSGQWAQGESPRFQWTSHRESDDNPWDWGLPNFDSYRIWRIHWTKRTNSLD